MLKCDLKTLLLAIAAAALTLISTVHSVGQPLVPINTGFSHWDHHWIMWTPQHPVFEAVEVMTVANSESPKGTLVRVFFTERAGGKKQVYYFNNAAVAKRWPTGAFFREIEHQISGEPGKPLNLIVKFKDRNDLPVELSFTFDSKQTLSKEYAGLTDQSGHGAENVFLLFFRELTATAGGSKLLIGGEDYSIKRDLPGGMQAFYRTGYRLNLYVATIVYGETQFDWKQNELASSRGFVFKKVSDANGEVIYRTDQRADKTVVEFSTNTAGELREYRHRLGPHTLKIEFDSTLPSAKSAKSGQNIRYRISLENVTKLVEGNVIIKSEGSVITYEWQHESPAWTKNYHLISTINLTSNNRYTLNLARKKQ
jgi:hypothetical protein